MNSETIEGVNLVGEVVTIAEDGEHAHHSELSPDGQCLAVVFGNGVLRVMNAATLETLSRLGPGGQYKDLPATCVRWFTTPQSTTVASGSSSEGASHQLNLVSVSSAGGVFGWCFDESATLERVAVAVEENNEIATVDISFDGSRFVTAGSDRILRVYNTSDFTCIQKMTQGVDPDGNMRSAHINRVLSVRHVTATLIVSAGWESPVQLWDARTGRSFAQLHGAQTCSDCIEPLSGAAAFIVASGNATDEMRPVLIATGTAGGVLEEESNRVSAAVKRAARRVIVARMDPTSGYLWCLSLSPYAVTVVSLSTGDIVASLPLPAVPMNLCLRNQLNTAFTGYVSCHGSRIVCIKPI